MSLRRGLAALVLSPLLLTLGCQRLATPDAEARAVQVVEKLGGKVVREDNNPAKPVVGIDLQSTKVTDAGLKELADLKELQTLDLTYTRVTDAGLKELADLKGLQTLKLGAAVTDATLRTLREIGLLHAADGARAAGGKRPSNPSDVVTLDLGYTQVSYSGLKELAALKGLQTLNLTGCPWVGDGGLNELAALKGLQSLSLNHTQVTDAGLKELADLKGLRSLNLSQGGVTDAGLKEVAGPKGLQTLDLSNTRVTNMGVKELAGLKDLQTLKLTFARVTDAAVADLRKAMPNCEIMDVNVN